MSERQVTIEVHATASKYWGCMETLDRNGNLYRKDIEEDRKSTVNGNALQALISALAPAALFLHPGYTYR